MDGQGAQLLQQVGDLLGQLAQQETEPTIQRGIMRVMKELEPMMNLIAADDQQDMSSGLATPNGPPGQSDQGMGGPGGPPPDFSGAGAGGPGGPGMPPGGPGGGIGGPPDMGGNLSSEGPLSDLDRSTQSGPPPRSFRGANKAAMDNLRKKGTFSRSGATETEKSKNRREGGRSLSQGRK